MNLRDVFPNARFSPPATVEMMAEVESSLGIKLPEELRAAGPQPNASYCSVGNGPLPLVATILLKKQAFTNLPFREFYLECDGFREDRGNAKYLLSLVAENHIGSLVTTTSHLWHEVSVPCLGPFVFFGSSSGDEYWGIRWQHSHEIIAYHHHMGDEYEIVGTVILDVWKADYALYDEIDQ